jgi:hypothetical protein
MPSPITTSGFSVQNMPNVQFADPRLMVPQYSNIIPAISQGAGLYNQLSQIPIQRQLQQLQLQEAQNRLAQAPIEQQLAALRLGEAQQQAAIPQFVPQSVDIIGGTKELRPVDPGASFENFQITEHFTPRQRVTRGLEVMAGGEARPVERRDTLATAGDVAAVAAKEAMALKSAEALATQRLRGKEFESTSLVDLYNNAVDSGDTEAASIYKARIDRLNTRPGFLPEGTAYQRRIETMAADAGLTLAAANELAQTAQGAEALAQLAVRNKAVARDPLNASFAPSLTPQQQAIITRAGQPVGVEEIFSAPSGNTAAAPSFNTVEEAEAAAKSQGWKGPVKIIIGGRPATWQ